MTDNLDGVLGSLGINQPTETVLGKVLKHHGVKGQKWGVRKPRSAGPGPASKAAPTKKTAGTKAPKKAPKSVKKMSDQELKKIITRIENEKRYTQLTSPKVNAAHKFIKDTMVNVGKQEATKLANKAGAVIVAQAMGSIAKQVAKSPNANQALIKILTG